MTAFDVSADGGTLVVGYAATGGATPTEAMTLAVIRHTARAWSYTKEDDLLYISDGKWKLRCADKWGTLVIGTDTWNATAGCGYANDYVGEVLDLSVGQATNTVDGGWKKIIGHRSSALGASATHKTPRVILFSANTENVNDYQQFMKNWDSVEEVVISASRITKFDSWAGWGTALRRIVFDASNVTSIADNALVGSADNWIGEDTDAAQWNFPALKTIGNDNFKYTDLAGALALPKVATMGNTSFYECHYLTEVRLGAEAKSVTSIGKKVLAVTDKGGDRAVGRLKKLVIGGAGAGFTVAEGAFANQPLEEVVFTGGVPTFADGFAFSDTAARTMFFAVPLDDAAGYDVWALETDGRRAERVPSEVRSGRLFFTANVKSPTGARMLYEVVKKHGLPRSRGQSAPGERRESGRCARGG